MNSPQPERHRQPIFLRDRPQIVTAGAHALAATSASLGARHEP
jgi:hypothetical protein